jgi:hypothetical protein
MAAAVLTSLVLQISSSRFEPNMLVFWPFWFAVIGLALAYGIPVVAALALASLVSKNAPSLGLALAISIAVILFEVTGPIWLVGTAFQPTWLELAEHALRLLPRLLVPAFAFLSVAYVRRS